jgi:hypothetical protein
MRIVDQAGEVSDEMLLLGDNEAVDVFFDEINVRRLRFMLWLLVAAVAVYQLVLALSGAVWLAAAAGLVVVADLLLLRSIGRAAVSRNLRQICAGVLLGHFVVLQLFHLGLDSTGPVLWFLLLLVLAARLRLATSESVSLLAALYAVLAARLILIHTLLMKQGFPAAELASLAIALAAAFAAAAVFAYRSRRRFLARWRSEAVRHRDRLRMKQELEYAREIQLSMLPLEAPEVPGLDIAALSLPATEVGGDYYDYFLLDGQRLAVVVGDVTGHGVASGLVLSGVRSGLNLLEDELGAPRLVLDRVNRMLKKISTPRMLMTLSMAVLDRRAREVVVATAAHPPALRLAAADGTITEIGRGSLPLGAMASTGYLEDRVAIAPGDVLLLYSDGLVETIDDDEQQYGWGRLHEALMQAADEPSAKAVRDRILRDVWEFKGEAEQVDDVTMVVIRVID